MKKLTSLLLAGMLTVSGCACAVTASAAGDDTTANLLVTDFNGNYSTETTSYEFHVGDIIECTIEGTSTIDGLTGFSGIWTKTFFNQESATQNGEIFSNVDMLSYSTEYYDEGAFYQTGKFPGAMVVTRPEESKEFDRDLFDFSLVRAVNTGSFTPSQTVVKLTLKIDKPGTSYINTIVNDIVYVENNDVVTNNDALRTTTTLKVVKSAPSTPTEAPTAAPTVAPTVAPTAAPTVAPTEASAPTEAPTVAPTEASAPTEAPTFDPKADHTYTVTGSDALFDPSWDPTADKYDMVLNTETGLYELVVPVTEEQKDSDVDYKVLADHAWDFSFNTTGPAVGLDSNAHLYIPDNAVAIKFTFNTETLCADAVIVTDSTAPTEAPTVAPTVAPTDAPTDAPTNAPTDASTDAPTDAPTAAPTDAPTDGVTEPTDYVTEPTDLPTPSKPATPDSPTSVVNPGNGSSNGNASTTTTGKVATGDSTSVAILLGVLMLAGAAVVVFRKKITH